MTATLGKAANTCTRMHCMLCVRACLLVVHTEAPSDRFWHHAFCNLPNSLDLFPEPSTVSMSSIYAFHLVSPYSLVASFFHVNWASEVLWKTELQGHFMFGLLITRIVAKFLRTCG